MTSFDISICDWRVRLREKTLKSHTESAKEICVNRDSMTMGKEKTVKLPKICAAIQGVDEVT